MTQFIQVLILGLALGGVFALMASGLTLIFGVMRIVNLAHPAFILLAAYLSLTAFQEFGIDPLLFVFISVPLMYGFGVLVYKLVFQKDAGKPKYTQLTVLVAFALALIVEGTLGFIYTNTYRSTNPPYASDAILIGPNYIPTGQFYAVLMSIAFIVALWAFLQFSRTGYAIRATMQNRSSAQLVGVNVEKVSTIAFGIGVALAGAAGPLVGFVFSFFPARHWEWIAVLMSLIVLGGLGSLLGAVVGAFLLSVMAAFVSAQFGPVWSPMTFFLALFLILLVRPQGLFGKPLEAS